MEQKRSAYGFWEVTLLRRKLRLRAEVHFGAQAWRLHLLLSARVSLFQHGQEQRDQAQQDFICEGDDIRENQIHYKNYCSQRQ